MTVSLAASLLELALGSELGASGDAGRNRCTLEGVTWHPMPDGAVELRVRRFEATALRLASGPLVLEIGRIDVHELVAQLRTEAGVPRLASVQAGAAEVSGMKLHGPLVLPPQIQKIREASQGADTAAATPGVAAGQAAADAWRLAPLGEAEGTIRGQITDAHLLFDAEVTVPIRHGQIDFNDAAVEHVGPDSRMGVSRMGIYVDAPNGRSYLYQFAAAPVAGVVFEHRGALLGPWVSERGKLQLRDFAESMLRQGRRGPGQGLTQQARLLLGRTSLSGEVQLGEGLIAVPGLQVHLEGRNAIGLRSQFVGRGLTVEMASLTARDAVAAWQGAQMGFDRTTAKLELEILVEGPAMRFALHVENGTVAGLRMDLQRRWPGRG
ncbi:hypothetical protein [Variovorax paradoxus]|uniref:hypothetical protein n=1 Tax=Variovorax paradoxus TaxID=34073 RepID=UPI00278B1A9B|nr:hypothetical protein [Variovorax paradoxus]MDQ0586466.1 hypothetical protein [Variovorax paradoxus]